MTGRRFRIDCPKFRRIWSRDTSKLNFRDFGNSWETLHHRLPPRWSLEILGGPWMLLGSSQNDTRKNKCIKRKVSTCVHFEVWKDARQRIIEISLVKFLSTSMACHSVTNRLHHECAGCIMSTHDASWLRQLAGALKDLIYQRERLRVVTS